MQLRQAAEPQVLPTGLRVHDLDVVEGAPAVQTPAAEQALLVIVPLSVPVSAQVVAPTHVPLQVVVDPQSMPLGLKVQLRDVAVEPVATHDPPALQVFEVTVPASVPAVLQAPPPDACTQVPDQVVVMPHGVPLGLKVHAREVGVVLVT
jgi:hypothetical protein